MNGLHTGKLEFFKPFTIRSDKSYLAMAVLRLYQDLRMEYS